MESLDIEKPSSDPTEVLEVAIEGKSLQSENEAVQLGLLALGYSAPTWDNFELTRVFPTVNPPESALLTSELSPLQQFLVKVWPRIESFFTEDEDLTVMLHAETVLKNGNLTRIFKFCYFPATGQLTSGDNKEILWEFVLEKQILPGFKWNNNNSNFIGNLRQKWAHVSPGKKVQEVAEFKMFSRSFDTQSHSTKFKVNRSSAKVLDSLQKDFLNDLRKYLIEGFADNVSGVGLMEESKRSENEGGGQLFLRGKEIQFEEEGNQIVWSVAQRKIAANSFLGNKVWFVNAPRKRESPLTMRSEDHQTKLKNSNSNPFVFDDVLGDVPSGSEQQEYVRQVVESRIEDFVGGLWPHVRNFFLEVAATELPLTAAVQNGNPTKVAEVHFDSLDERNRWKVLLEISIVCMGSGGDTSNGQDRHWATAVAPSTDSGSNANDRRSYKSFERRGTTSTNSQDANEYFNGLYKRWFLQHLQMALVHCYAHVDSNALTLQHTKFDPQLFEVGKDIEFCSDGGIQTVWSFSVQKIPKYLKDDMPDDVWAYKISEGTPTSLRTTESHDSIAIRAESSTSDVTIRNHQQRPTAALPAGRASKSRSSIKNMVAKTFRPVIQKLGRKSMVSSNAATPVRGRLNREDSASKSTLNASAYMADGESMWSKNSENQSNF